MQRMRGITLIELMVALGIVALLAAIVYPNYTAYQLRSFRTVAYTDLGNCALGAGRVFANSFSYVAIDAGGGVPVAAVCPQFSPQTGTAADARYQISVTAATATGFTLRATPINAQAGDGIVELDSTNARRRDKDNSGGFGLGENDWAD